MRHLRYTMHDIRAGFARRAPIRHPVNPQFANANPQSLFFANELRVSADGWAQIAPLGDFPSLALMEQPDGSQKPLPAIQRLDAQACAAMVREFEAARKRARKYLSGRPIYVGHPDVPALAHQYPDKTPKGVIAELQARADGLYGKPVFTNEGSDLVEGRKFRFFSGRLVDCEPAGQTAAAAGGAGLPIFRPRVFLSVGLTNQPHLPVQMLNERRNPKTNMNKTKLLALCAHLGIPLTSDADDAAVDAALDLAAQKAGQAAAFANENPGLQSALQAREGELAALRPQLAALAGERDALRAQFQNERAARVADELAGAVKEGRVTAAEQPGWAARLNVEAQFANELAALRALPPRLKTVSVTIQRGDRKIEVANAQDRRELINELVAAEMAGGKCDYDRAFTRVQKKFPALFEAMKKPAAA